MITKYRPKNLSEFLGHDVLIGSIEKHLKNKTLPHAILISGESGCGKTTLARIIANYLGCTKGGYREINCGETGGKDKTISILDMMKYNSILSNVSVYVFDEAQGLTKDSQRALLKPIEEVKNNVYIIFCSTEPEKLDKALRGRLVHYTVGKIDDTPMYKILSHIWDSEGYNQPEKEKFLQSIIKRVDGIPREGITLLAKLRDTSIEEAKELVDGYTPENESMTIDFVRALAGVGGLSWTAIMEIYKKINSPVYSVHVITAKYFKSMFIKNPSERRSELLMLLSKIEDTPLHEEYFLSVIYLIHKEWK